MKLLGSTKSKITNDKKGENVPYLENSQVVLNTVMLLTLVIKQSSIVWYTSVSNKSFGQLLDTSPNNYVFLKTFDSYFSYIELWFTDQNSNPVEIEHISNI